MVFVPEFRSLFPVLGNRLPVPSQSPVAESRRPRFGPAGADRIQTSLVVLRLLSRIDGIHVFLFLELKLERAYAFTAVLLYIAFFFIPFNSVSGVPSWYSCVSRSPVAWVQIA